MKEETHWYICVLIHEIQIYIPHLILAGHIPTAGFCFRELFFLNN
jgi:hypothetical protein